jgi:hypothetical protein
VIQWLVDKKIEIRGHAQFPRDIDWHSRSRHSQLEEKCLALRHIPRRGGERVPGRVMEHSICGVRKRIGS